MSRETVSIYSVPKEIAPALLLTLDEQIIQTIKSNDYKLAEDIIWTAKQLRKDLNLSKEGEE